MDHVVGRFPGAEGAASPGRSSAGKPPAGRLQQAGHPGGQSRTSWRPVTARKDTKKVKKIDNKQGKKQANKQIDKRAPGLSVASAATAESADTANGIKPVKVDFAASSSSGPTTFVSQGGVQVDGECDAAGHAELNLRSTAVGGIVKLTALNETGTASSKQDVGDFDPSEAVGYETAETSPDRDLSVAVSFRGADGTTLTGDLPLVDRVLLGPNCRIAATLLVA